MLTSLRLPGEPREFRSPPTSPRYGNVIAHNLVLREM